MFLLLLFGNISHFEHSIKAFAVKVLKLQSVYTAKLINVLQRLVDQDGTVVVIEHNLDLVASSDWVIDIGPDAGEEGGKVVCAGTPHEIAETEVGFTSKYLKQYFTQ